MSRLVRDALLFIHQMARPALLERKRTHFVLWLPGPLASEPQLVIGRFRADALPRLVDERSIPLVRSPDSDELWEVAASACGLSDDTVYHYWFEQVDTLVYRTEHLRVRCTDPTAQCIDWRLTANLGDDTSAASVVRYRNGRLEPSDPDSRPPFFTENGAGADVPMASLPENRQLVIYELPTSWSKVGEPLDRDHVGVGTFRDVLTLIEPDTEGGHLARSARLHHRHHLIELGVNALELLPPADTFADRGSWGYATSNYFAPDFDLGRPFDPNASVSENALRAPQSQGDLLDLVRACHRHGIRFFYDAVMAFSHRDPYRLLDFMSYHVFYTDLEHGPFDHLDPEQGLRDGFGGDLWKYADLRPGFDPVSGDTGAVHRARRHMICHLLHWMDQYHVDGLRLDSVNNYGNWDFASDIQREARAAWRERWVREGNPEQGADARFLVVGEELSVPKGLLSRIDGLWNEDFKRILRKVLLGHSAEGESFESSVKKLIDCRRLGFSDLAQAVNYVGSHDVGEEGNERLYNFLDRRGVVLKEKPIKLGFVCLLTAVGIPMIFAGDEFADEHDIDIWSDTTGGRTPDTNKQLDPVNFERLRRDAWRREVFSYVSRLVKLRTSAPALCVNDTEFIHVDFEQGKRVLVWRRGRLGIDDPVVVVANFSDWGTPDPFGPGSEYRVSNWPESAPNQAWWEVTQSRRVEPGRAGREPIFPWEAKVYQLRAPEHARTPQL